MSRTCCLHCVSLCKKMKSYSSILKETRHIKWGKKNKPETVRPNKNKSKYSVGIGKPTPILPRLDWHSVVFCINFGPEFHYYCQILGLNFERSSPNSPVSPDPALGPQLSLPTPHYPNVFPKNYSNSATILVPHF